MQSKHNFYAIINNKNRKTALLRLTPATISCQRMAIVKITIFNEFYGKSNVAEYDLINTFLLYKLSISIE